MFEVSALVLGRLQHLGDEGRSWLAGLEQLVTELESEWGCRVGNPVGGGSAGFVAHAVDRHGRPSILKVAIPAGGDGYADFEREALVLSLAEGPGYVEVFEVDHNRRAFLLERLGPPLAALGLTVDEQIEILAATVQPSWRHVSETIELPTGAAQARWLGEFIARQWQELGEPCSRQVRNRALEFVENRLAAFDPATAVLIHADAHSSNVLLDPSSADGQRRFKMIDPEGLISEPAHELAIPLRGWTGELLAGDVVELCLRWCTYMSDVSGVDAIPIWEWACVERVSTGLLLLHLGDPVGRDFLNIATQCNCVSIDAPHVRMVMSGGFGWHHQDTRTRGHQRPLRRALCGSRPSNLGRCTPGQVGSDGIPKGQARSRFSQCATVSRCPSRGCGSPAAIGGSE